MSPALARLQGPVITLVLTWKAEGKEREKKNNKVMEFRSQEPISADDLTALRWLL